MSPSARRPTRLGTGTPAFGSAVVPLQRSRRSLNRTRLWRSSPAAQVSDADLHAALRDKRHFDMNGWRTLKFFLCLTSITEADGPHRCISGTYRRRPFRHQHFPTVGQPTDELERVHGKERFLMVTGDAGDGFAEDPYVLHTDPLCRDKSRLILAALALAGNGLAGNGCKRDRPAGPRDLRGCAVDGRKNLLPTDLDLAAESCCEGSSLWQHPPLHSVSQPGISTGSKDRGI